MAIKKVVQDIVPGERRSIRKITIEREDESIPKTTRRKIVQPIEVNQEDEDQIIQEIQGKKPKIIKKKGSFKLLFVFIIILASIIAIGVALSLSYSKATVTITPKVTNFDISGTFTAKKSASTISSEDLAYDVISVSDILKETIPATKGPLIQTKAKGVAIIYNNYGTSTQTLVAGTRLATTDGLVYRTTSTIVVPGKKTGPGSIAVNIIADLAGEKYNMNIADLKTDFKLPGYQGNPKYDGFYAKLKTDITGGFSGNKMSIDPDIKAKTIKDIEDTLKIQLLGKLSKTVSAGYILYDNANNIEFDVQEPIMKSNSDADISVKGTAYGAIFNQDSLIKYIAGKEIRKFPSSTYTIDGDKDLVFSVSNIKDFSAKKGTSLIFTLKGPISITGTLSESKLKEELKGIKLSDSSKVFAKYPAIANAYALITPFWLRTFPSVADKISVEYKH